MARHREKLSDAGIEYLISNIGKKSHSKIAADLGVSRQLISYHVKQLERVYLVKFTPYQRAKAVRVVEGMADKEKKNV